MDTEWNILYEKLDLIHKSGAKVVLSKLPIGDVATQYFADRYSTIQLVSINFTYPERLPPSVEFLCKTATSCLLVDKKMSVKNTQLVDPQTYPYPHCLFLTFYFTFEIQCNLKLVLLSTGTCFVQAVLWRKT